MKLLRSLLLTALLCSTSTAASKSSSARKLSKKSTRSDKERPVALKMEATMASNKAIENGVEEINTASNESKSKSNTDKSFKNNINNHMIPEPTLERQAVQVQVKLGNMDLEDLNAEETMYFESALRKAIQLAQDQHQGQDEKHGEDQVTIGAILVENGHGTHQHDGGRNLRGDRSLWLSYSFFNVWTIIETFRCRFCFSAPAAVTVSEEDDDDDDDYVAPAYDDYYFDSRAYYDQWKEDMNTYTRAPTPAPTQRPTYEMDEWEKCQANNMVLGIYGGCRRKLGSSENSNTSLEDILCGLLREGPHECFHSVDECTLEVSEW
ncbi:unnamed protein product [Cylindrotheca closterium]|uniref:Uncharacterized protein n=1 Tax=Cylindrotheca closterium TaxID=2856 RepID=A0AAD2G913_9STRA|nr:unnamed protein product [Cylindrotheca closterium]